MLVKTRRELAIGGVHLLAAVAGIISFPSRLRGQQAPEGQATEPTGNAPKAKAHPATDARAGILREFTRVTENLAMVPVGAATGIDLTTQGGKIYGKTLLRQLALFASPPYTELTDHKKRGRARAKLSRRLSRSKSTKSTQIDETQTIKVYSNGIGYTFLRFLGDRANCSIPMGNVASQDGEAYGGAMTILSGPNLVALRVLTDLLKERNYSWTQISDLCWPLTPCHDGAERLRASITFERIAKVKDPQGNDVFLDRDVLQARSATCVLRYTHQNGVPDGGGEGALVVAGQEQFRFEFKYDLAMLSL